MLGDELVRAIDAFPLEAWLTDVGFALESQWERVARCPRCGKDDKLVANVRTRRWHCWTCQRKEPRAVRDPTTGLSVVRNVTVEGGGGVLALIAWWFGCRRGEAAAWILRIAKPLPVALAQIPTLERLAAALEHEPDELVPPAAPEGAGPLSAHNLCYLATRGIDEPMARAYGLFGCHSGRYAQRVVFPAWGRFGELRYWQARATWRAEDDEARGRRHIKAINPPRDPGLITSEHSVFNVHRATALGGGRVALCEGPVSAMKAADDATCVWGKQVSPHQITELVRAGVEEVDLWFDGPSEREPEGAWPEMRALAPLLQLFFRAVRLVFHPAGDPGDYTRAQNAEIRSRAVLLQRPNLLRIA